MTFLEDLFWLDGRFLTIWIAALWLDAGVCQVNPRDLIGQSLDLNLVDDEEVAEPHDEPGHHQDHQEHVHLMAPA